MAISVQGRVRPSLVLSPLVALLVVLAMAGSVLAGQTVSPARGGAAADAPAGPKVVIIVGPTGSLTNYFLRDARAAERVARQHSNNVHTFYTPYATWAAVKPALQRADIVIYLGHGNGWPSPYRASLFRPTQNGLGLNPIAGGNNHTHRYYGEKYLARDVKLARGAIVLLHHLCYAAGNSEPGLPEGPHGAAKQRVDNYAAGWLAAGASAVVAEAYLGPAYYVRALFETKRSIERIWRASPRFNGNVESWASKRTDGATALIDPYVPGKRYGRSLVVRGGVEEADRTSAPQAADEDSDGAEPEPEPEPEAVWRPPLAGAMLGEPLLRGPIVQGTTVELALPVELGAAGWLPENLLLEAHWLPVVPETDAPETDETAEVEGEGDIEIELEPFSGSAGPAEATPTETGLLGTLETPPQAGAYELRLRVASADGDQLSERRRDLTVRTAVQVARPLSAGFGLPAELDGTAGEPLLVPLSLTNTGNVEWQELAEDLLDERGPDPFAAIPPAQAVLVLEMLRVGPDGLPVGEPERVALSEVSVPPGSTLELELDLRSPEFSGDYMLVFDVQTPTRGPLALNGNEAVAVRLHVAPAPAPLATPGSF